MMMIIIMVVVVMMMSVNDDKLIILVPPSQYYMNKFLGIITKKKIPNNQWFMKQGYCLQSVLNHRISQ
jgi:hypothetical protein